LTQIEQERKTNRKNSTCEASFLGGIAISGPLSAATYLIAVEHQRLKAYSSKLQKMGRANWWSGTHTGNAE